MLIESKDLVQMLREPGRYPGLHSVYSCQPVDGGMVYAVFMKAELVDVFESRWANTPVLLWHVEYGLTTSGEALADLI